MEYEAKIEMTKAYFEESIEQWLIHRSKFRRRQIQIGVLLIIVGAMIHELRVLSVVVLSIGLFEVAEFFFYRRRWIHKRMNARSKNSDSSVDIRVGDSGMYKKGPTSEGTVSWDGVKAATPTAKGLFISIGDGMSVYFLPQLSL